MVMRKDGCDTRERLLEVAARVFAERGYKDTTIAQVCKAAHANVAAVNYHFGSKDGLYGQVWRQAFDKSFEIHPLDEGLSESASAEQKLKALIRSHVHRVLDQGTLGEAGQILLMEMANPTEVIQEVFADALQPVVMYTYAVIKELLGPDAPNDQIHLCTMSVVHLCFAFSHRRGKHAKHPFNTDIMAAEGFSDRLADHITEFSLAGIAGIRAKLSKDS